MAWTREDTDYFNENGLRISKVDSPVPGQSDKFWAVFDLDGKRISPYRKYLKDAKKDADSYSPGWSSDHLM